MARKTKASALGWAAVPQEREAKGKLTRRLNPDVQVDERHGVALEIFFASQRHRQRVAPHLCGKVEDTKLPTHGRGVLAAGRHLVDPVLDNRSADLYEGSGSKARKRVSHLPPKLRERRTQRRQEMRGNWRTMARLPKTKPAKTRRSGEKRMPALRRAG